MFTQEKCDEFYNKYQPKDELFGELRMSKKVYLNREVDQEYREQTLDKLVQPAITIAKKYLCLIRTEDEYRIVELLDKEFLKLARGDKRARYDDAEKIIKFAKVILDVAHNMPLRYILRDY